jgi:hypothetical protein
MLSLGGQPNLENRIASLTPAYRLSHIVSSLFGERLIDNEPDLLTGEIDPRENGYLKVSQGKAFKMAGFITPSPRKGTETGWCT